MMINGVNDMNRNLSVNVAGVDTQDISSARLKAMKRSDRWNVKHVRTGI